MKRYLSAQQESVWLAKSEQMHSWVYWRSQHREPHRDALMDTGVWRESVGTCPTTKRKGQLTRHRKSPGIGYIGLEFVLFHHCQRPCIHVSLVSSIPPRCIAAVSRQTQWAHRWQAWPHSRDRQQRCVPYRRLCCTCNVLEGSRFVRSLAENIWSQLREGTRTWPPDKNDRRSGGAEALSFFSAPTAQSCSVLRSRLYSVMNIIVRITH